MSLVTRFGHRFLDILSHAGGTGTEEAYMERVGIKQFYNTKYDAKNPDFWKGIELPNGPDKEYVCIGVKASNYFMPKETLSEKGPGGGGWILMVPT